MTRHEQRYKIMTILYQAFLYKNNNINYDINDIINDYSILSQKTDTLMVEATGGLMTPLNKRLFSYHLPKRKY